MGVDGAGLWKPDEAGSYVRKFQQHPRVFMEEVLGLTAFWNGQYDVMEAIARDRRVAVPSGHALGKDYVSSALILWFLYSFPGSIVVATAPTDRQVDMVIWGELTEKFNQAKIKLGGRLVTKFLEVDPTRKWYAIGFTTKDVKSQQGKFQGFHARHVFILFSEAQAIERTIWEQADSLMTSGNARMLAIGNPIVSYGAFYDAIQPGSEWTTVRLDCEKSPNVIERREVIPGMCSHIWVDEMAKKHGRNHPKYLMRVKGIPPKSSDNIPIEPAWLEWANTHGLEVVPEEGPHVAGLDPAAMGSNKTVFVRRIGMRVVEIKKFEKMSTTETTGIAVALLNEGLDMLFLDATGGSIGSAIYDSLVEQGFRDRVTPVNFGAAPKCPEYKEDGTPMTDEDKENPALNPAKKFADVATRMHDNTARLLEKHKIGLPFDEDMSMQMLSRKIKRLSNGKIKLEPKDDYKARGYESPDESDALDLCMCDPGIYGMRSDAWEVIEEDDTYTREAE